MLSILGGILFIIIIFVLLEASASKGSPKEKLNSAVITVASEVAGGVINTANAILESSSEKEIRLAREYVWHRNCDIYNYNSYLDRKSIKDLVGVEEQLSKKLKVLNIPEKKWTKVARMLLLIGVIVHIEGESKTGNDIYSVHFRERILEDYKDGGLYNVPLLLKALKVLKIPVREWIKYGDVVIDMHNLRNDPDFKKYSLIFDS